MSHVIRDVSAKEIGRISTMISSVEVDSYAEANGISINQARKELAEAYAFRDMQNNNLN